MTVGYNGTSAASKYLARLLFGVMLIGAVFGGWLALNSPRVAQANGGVVTGCTEAEFRAALSGGGIIKFACDGTVTLSSSIAITADTILDGGGFSLTLSGGSHDRLFTVSQGVSLTLRNLTVSGGLLGNGNGGAIVNNGGLVVYNVSFISNQVSFNGGTGGALVNNGTTTIYNSLFAGNSGFGGGAIVNNATLTINNSTFDSNSANQGGAILNTAGATATIVNSTFNGNNAVTEGGAIRAAGGSVAINSSTFANNRATNGGNTFGLGAGGAISVQNTILSGGNPGTASSVPNCTTAITNGGSNLQWPDSSCLAGQPAVDPKLASGLNSNGGPTSTISLVTSGPAPSPALNAGNANCPATDQRYASRSGLCDIGAYEANSTALQAPGLALAFGPTTIGAGGQSTLTFTITNPNPGAYLGNIAFADLLPGGMTVASQANLSNSCLDSAVLISNDRRAVGFSMIHLGPGANCVISFSVTSQQLGNATNTVNRITASQTGPVSLSGQTSLTIFGNPTLKQVFTPGAIPISGTSTLALTLGNPNGTTKLHNVVFSDTLPSGITVATPANLTNTCNPESQAGMTGPTLSVTGVILDYNATCQIRFDVTGTAAGAYTNTVTSLQSDETQATALNSWSVLNIVDCADPLAVTTATDGTSCGTLRFAAGVAGPADTISLNLPAGTHTLSFSSGLTFNGGKLLAIPTGQSCSSAAMLTLDFTSVSGDAVTVRNGTFLRGLIIKGGPTTGRLLVVGPGGSSGPNQLQCVVTTRSGGPMRR